MTKAERVVWAAATMQAIAEAFDQILLNELRMRKSMPGKRPTSARKVLSQAIRSVEQSLSEKTDVWVDDVRYKLTATTVKEYLATFPKSNYWRRGLDDIFGDILHPDSTVAQRKPREIKYG